MSADLIALGAMWFAVFLFSTTLHEAAHAFVAYKLGDSTAYHGGQVTLNPLPHMQREPFGTLIMPLLSFGMSQGSWMMGWASAPYDPSWALRHPKRAAVMALAGPLSNLSLVLLSGVFIRVGMAAGHLVPPESISSISQIVAATDPTSLWAALATLLSILFSLNLVLFVFNLLPLPPLDGSSLPLLFLKDSAAQAYFDFTHQFAFQMIGILVAWRVFPYLFFPIFSLCVNLLLRL